MTQPKVYIYWDNSNIFISSKVVCTERREPFPDDIRLMFDNLFKLAHANRTIGKAIAVGSIPPEHRELWERFRKSGVEIELYERGQDTGKEQGTDQCLQVHMLRDLADNNDNPQIAVLLTGDGAGYREGAGFHADLERMQKAGWGIEVIAWDRSCRGDLKNWAMKIGNYIKLEHYYESITYIKGGRGYSPINLTHRPKSIPRGIGIAKPGEEIPMQPSEEKSIEIDQEVTTDLTRTAIFEKGTVVSQNRAEIKLLTEENLKLKKEIARTQCEANRLRNLRDQRHLRKRERQAKKRARKKRK